MTPINLPVFLSFSTKCGENGLFKLKSDSSEDEICWSGSGSVDEEGWTIHNLCDLVATNLAIVLAKDEDG